MYVLWDKHRNDLYLLQMLNIKQPQYKNRTLASPWVLSSSPLAASPSSFQNRRGKRLAERQGSSRPVEAPRSCQAHGRGSHQLDHRSSAEPQLSSAGNLSDGTDQSRDASASVSLSVKVLTESMVPECWSPSCRQGLPQQSRGCLLN